MRASRRLGVAVTVCCSALLFVLAVMSSVAGAAPAPNLSGIWLVYVPASNPSPAQIFVMHDVSNRITGTWGEFTLSGTFSPSTGTATLCAGCGQHSVLQTTNWQVKVTFKSTSTAQSNHPTLRGASHYVSVPTGVTVPNSTESMRAVRCSYQTNAKAVALCG